MAIRFPVAYCPHLPTAKQYRYLQTESIEALYGGAAGGGKSDALLMGALQYIDEPNYAALLLRRSFRDLNQPDALIPRSKEWLSGKAQWNQQSQRWTFASGSTLTFGYLENPDDVYQYQGAAFQFIGFDELTQFRENDYRYLFSRLRRLQKSDVPIRMRSASNPGGRGHDWVKRRFLSDAKEPDAEFVGATLDDNPYLDQSTYRQSLALLDPTTRAQLLSGNWDAGDSGIIDYAWILSCETDEPPPIMRRPEEYIGIDVGRSKGRTCIWSFQRAGDILWTKELAVLQNVPFAQQFTEIDKRIRGNANLVKCQIDKGYNPQLAEDLERRYPGKVVGVQMTQGRMGQFAAQLANAFEGRKIRIPAADEDLRGDLRLVKRIDIRSGQPVVLTERDSTGHADRFWAGALALDASLWTRGMPSFTRPLGVAAGVR